MAKRGVRVTGVTVGEPSGDLAGHVSGRCTPVHPLKELYKDDWPRKGPHVTGGVRVVRATKAESVHRVCVFHGKVRGEDRERAGCIELI